MAKYKKRSDGRYHTKITVGYDDSGKELKKDVYGRTVQEFEQNIAEIKASVSTGTYADDNHLTVGQWGEQWLSIYKKEVSYSTFHGYKNIIDNHLTPIYDIRLKSLRKSDVQHCINLAAGHYDIQRRIKLTLNQMLEAAIDDNLVYKNVCRGTTLPRKPKTQTRALTQAEKSILPLCNFTPEEKCFVWLLWYTGMRPEEVRALTRNDIDLATNIITVSKAISFEANQPILGPPKTDAGYRTIDILSPLHPILSDYLAKLDTLYLFTKKDGSYHTKTTYRRFWGRIFTKINTQMGGNDTIKATDLYPYVFRHEYATMLYYSGIDIKEAARLMGHNDTKTIIEIYAELDSKKSASSSKLEQFLASGS